MTKEEAKIFLQSRIKLIDKYYPQVEDYREALDMAIKALGSWDKYSTELWQAAYELGKKEDAMRRKKGEWIKAGEWSEGFGMGETSGWIYECSECSEQVKNGYGGCSYNYCPYCGSDNREEADE